MTLSTPLLWVVLPLIVAGITGIFYQRRILGIILSSLTAIGLCLLAMFFPEDLTLSVGPFMMTFQENLGILGRQISVDYEILPFLTLVYALTGLWTLSSGIQGVPALFRPISLVITALLTAALGVQPFLYAALLILTAVLVSVPMLSQSGKKNHVGIFRYLSMQTLAMPFILVAGWLLTGVQILPPDSPLVGQTTMVLGLGFALWLGVFPFHSWVPMISQRSHSIVFSFLMFILPTTIIMFGLKFFDQYTFLRESQNIYETLRFIGMLMILLGGGWTAVQSNLKRAFGFSMLSETGFLLLAVGLSAQGGLVWLLLLFLLRSLGFWLWGYTLALIEVHSGSLEIGAVQGLARRYPIFSISLLLAQLSIAGLPLLAAFPIKMALLTAAFDIGTGLGAWVFIGSLGLFIFSIRLLTSLVMPEDDTVDGQWIISEKAHEYIPALFMIILLIILGLFPHTFLSGISNILTAFTHLQ